MKTILIADDDYANRSLPRLLLDKNDFQIIEVENGMQVLQIIKHQTIDYLLLDISLPEISGIDICRTIKEVHNNHHTKIIAYTAHSIEWEIKRISNAGFDQILIKPITRQQLINALKDFGNKDK